MYKINDKVVFENIGVCTILDVGTPDFVKSDDLYYIMQPLNDAGGTIYVKVDTDKRMRPLVSSDEAVKYLSGITDIEGIYDINSKVREHEFGEAIKSCDCEKWLAMIKGIESVKQQRIESGKKLNSSDSRFLQRAGKMLSGEFSIALKMSKEEIIDKIIGALE